MDERKKQTKKNNSVISLLIMKFNNNDEDYGDDGDNSAVPITPTSKGMKKGSSYQEFLV